VRKGSLNGSLNSLLEFTFATNRLWHGDTTNTRIWVFLYIHISCISCISTFVVSKVARLWQKVSETTVFSLRQRAMSNCSRSVNGWLTSGRSETVVSSWACEVVSARRMPGSWNSSTSGRTSTSTKHHHHHYHNKRLFTLLYFSYSVYATVVVTKKITGPAYYLVHYAKFTTYYTVLQ